MALPAPAPLLPSGLMDVLPPQASAEFRLVYHFLKTFTAFGYQPVIPPMAEYAKTLLAGQGEATGHHVFRTADTLAPEMLAIRADMTGQVARIATSSLQSVSRPLRLCYAGYTLRTAPEALKTRRQHTQVGIERFGDTKVTSVAEVLAVAAHALQVNGIEGLTLDLHYPSIMAELLVEFPHAMHVRVREAVRLKDIAALRQMKADTIAALLEISGPAVDAIAGLRTIAHPHVQEAVHVLEQLVAALHTQQVPATVTIDMLDLAGYGYYCGVGYTLFWNATGIEVGRGGCYRTLSEEEAVGFTLYVNDLLVHLPEEAPARVQAIPVGTPAKEAARLHAEGIITIFGPPL